MDFLLVRGLEAYAEEDYGEAVKQLTACVDACDKAGGACETIKGSVLTARAASWLNLKRVDEAEACLVQAARRHATQVLGNYRKGGVAGEAL